MREVCEVFEPPAMPSSRSGGGMPSSSHEHRRQLVVVVLAGVHQHLLVVFPQRTRHGCRLDELGPIADDG